MTLPASVRRPVGSRLLPWWPVLLFLCAGLCQLHAQQAAAPASQGRVALTDSFRAVAPTGKATTAVPAELARAALSSSEAAAPMEVELTLRMRHYDELQRRVAAGEIISREEMARRFLPDASDYQAVADWLTTQGLTAAPAGASHAVVVATGTPAQFENAFQTHFARVKFRGEEYTSAVAAPSVPADIQARVRNVHGLQPYLHPRKHAVTPTASPPYLVADILKAYDVTPTGLTGAGQTIGIIIDTLPLTTDLTRFWSDNGLSQNLGNYSTINVRNRTIGSPTGEETLDVEWSSGIAPGAQVVVYACGDLNFVNQCYSRVLDDLQNNAQPNLHQISMSYGAGEQTEETRADINSVHELFTAISAYGVSLFASSGDEGAYGNDNGTVEVVYPASDPFVTGVGGTTLTLNNAGAVYSETAWSPPGTPKNNHDSSGGGVSVVFPRPSWQVGTGVNAGGARQVPDVSLVGDPETGCYLVLKGRVVQYGGTSWSSPSWAGLCALLNQSRASYSLGPLTGGANPAFYPLLGTSAFRDITIGNNVLFPTQVGYDEVTGLGVPDFYALIQALGSAPLEPAPVITSDNHAESKVGADFTYSIVATNSPTSFNVTGLPAGLGFDSATGLIAGKVYKVGTYPIAMSATNSGGTYAATLTLTVTHAVYPGLVLSAFQPHASYANNHSGQFAVYLSEPTTVARTVQYTLAGTAVNGTDYQQLTGQLRIPAGKTYGIVKVVPLGTVPPGETVTVLMQLVPLQGYTIQTPNAVRIGIGN